MRPTTVGRALCLGLLAAALPALAGCGGGPDQAPPTTSSTVRQKATVAPSPTPSPSPTGRQRAPDDPAWTPEQLAAVRAVDAYYQVYVKVYADPAAANLGDWNTVTTDPYRAEEVQRTLDNIARGFTRSGAPVIIASRRVSPVEVVDGRPQVRITECDVDSPDLQPYIHGTPIPVVGEPQGVYEYTVQWVEAAQSWLIADIVDQGDRC